MSYFDGNKKIIYVSLPGGNVIGRAVVRLTKICYNVPKDTFGFTDVCETEMTNEESKLEYVVIFLERLYSGAQGVYRSEIENAVIKFVEEKAKRAGLQVVVSIDYQDTGIVESLSGYSK